MNLKSPCRQGDPARMDWNYFQIHVHCLLLFLHNPLNFHLNLPVHQDHCHLHRYRDFPSGSL